MKINPKKIKKILYLYFFYTCILYMDFFKNYIRKLKTKKIIIYFWNKIIKIVVMSIKSKIIFKSSMYLKKLLLDIINLII